MNASKIKINKHIIKIKNICIKINKLRFIIIIMQIR